MTSHLKYDREAEAELKKPYSTFAKVYRLVPSGISVLDVGCHSGRFGALLKRKGCRVTGLDIDAAAAAEARKALDRVVVADIEAPEVFAALGERFDAILFMDTLEHCRRPEEVLQRCRSALAPGGFVLVSIPNVAHWSNRLRLLLGRFDYEPTGLLDETHLRFYTLKTARELLEHSGYQVEVVDHRIDLPVFRARKPIGRLLARTVGARVPGLFSYQMIFKARGAAADS